MIFDRTPPSSLLRPTSELVFLRRAQRLLDRFSRAFPEVGYEIVWSSNSFNGQAFLDSENKRCVRIYGGLLRHRHIDTCGFLFVIAHETGHHVAKGEPHPVYVWLSSETRATAWAINECGYALGCRSGCVEIMKRGQRQVESVCEAMMI